MANYYKNDPNYERDLETAYDKGLPDWYQDTEQDDIKLVSLYRAERIMKLERQLKFAFQRLTDAPSWVSTYKP